MTSARRVVSKPDPDIKVLDKASLLDEVALIVGTRPGIVMFAPVVAELLARELPFFLLHTGQHYSPEMDAELFQDLGLPEPHHRLNGVAEMLTHGTQTAAMLTGIEAVLMKRRPRLVVVGGDANTNLAGALAARKLGLTVAHLEAGERSYDMRMPEEANRVMIDHISDFLLVTGPKAAANLAREAVRGQIIETGNPIVDASYAHVTRAHEASTVLERLSLAPGTYFLATLHREENVDDAARLIRCLTGLDAVGRACGAPVLLPMHPRTSKRLRQFERQTWVERLPGLKVVGAVSYLDFLKLLINAKAVLTDSGGVQQEACIHRLPCITLRASTEWSETLECGANVLVDDDVDAMVVATQQALEHPGNWGDIFGDGHAARRVVDACERILTIDRG